MSFVPASTAWFAHHEISLAWRDFLMMMTGGRRRRGLVLALVLAVFAIFVHLLVNVLVVRWLQAGLHPDKETLAAITGGGFLFWCVMLSQAMESVTRAYYARSDLDLLMSSPASMRRVFAVRTGAIALSTVALAALLASPVINMLALNNGPQWLAAYGVLVAFGALSAALSLLVVIVLFRLVGPKRTRLIAQVIAGLIGAGFVIGIQAAAIMAYGSMSRYALLDSPEFVAAMPDISHPIYLPARAAMGDLGALLVCLLLGLGALAVVTVVTSSSFGRHVLATAALGRETRGSNHRPTIFRPATPKQALRRKEWMLLRRDPWLLSQTLMQILYLLPPALMLWVNYGASAGAFIVVVPVLVMAAGQLAGGLAWLALSGEDAHDLVATAPITARTATWAKIEAVLGVIAAVLTPLLVLMALSAPNLALITAFCATLSAGSATLIQVWFRVPSRRSMFRRRQVASRAATLSEAFVSIMWAGTSAVLVAGSPFALLPAACALLALLIAWAVRPRTQ